MLGLALHLLHQPRALDDLGKAGVVLDIGGDRQLAAGLQAGHQDRLQIGARRIDRRRVAGRARADDQDFAVVTLGHAAASRTNFDTNNIAFFAEHRREEMRRALKAEHVVEAEGAVAAQQPVIAEEPAGRVADDDVGACPGPGAGRGVEQARDSATAASRSRGSPGATRATSHPAPSYRMMSVVARRQPRPRRRVDQMAQRVVSRLAEAQEQPRRQSRRAARYRIAARRDRSAAC